MIKNSYTDLIDEICLKVISGYKVSPHIIITEGAYAVTDKLVPRKTIHVAPLRLKINIRAK